MVYNVRYYSGNGWNMLKYSNKSLKFYIIVMVGYSSCPHHIFIRNATGGGGMAPPIYTPLIASLLDNIEYFAYPTPEIRIIISTTPPRTMKIFDFEFIKTC